MNLKNINWVEPLDLDQRGGMVEKLYPFINPLGAVKKSRDAAKDAAQMRADELAAAQAYQKSNAINAMKKGGKVKPKETRARGIAKDTEPVKRFARGGGVEQRGKTKGRFV